MENSSNKIKEIWKRVNNIAKTKVKNINQIKAIKDSAGNTVTDKRNRAEIFNEYFVNLSSKLNLQDSKL